MYSVNCIDAVWPSVRMVTTFWPSMLPATRRSFNRMATVSVFCTFCHSSGDDSRLIWKYDSVRDSGRARYLAVTDEEALAAFRRVAELEGIIPALESSHALAWVLANPGGELDVVCLSGRGDKDLTEVLERG